MDLKDYKKVGLNRTHTIFEHPDGHQIHVNHKKLPKDMHDELRAIPFADGGAVPEVEQKPDWVSQLMGQFGGGGSGAASMAPQEAAPVAQQISSTTTRPATSGNPVIPGMQQQQAPAASMIPNSQPMLQQGMADQKAGLLGEANALGAQGKQEAQAIDENQMAMKHLEESYTQEHMSLQKERATAMQEMKDLKIDPNRVYHNMGTGQKIATGIGLILGGFGAGLAGTENPVLNMLMKDIDRDTEAQKLDMNKKQNIISAYNDQLKDLKLVIDTTRMFKMDMLKTQLEKAAAQAKDPLSKQRALQAIGQVEEKMAPLMAEAAARSALIKSTSGGQVNPSKMIDLVVPKESRKEAREQLAKAEGVNKNLDALEALYTDGKKIGGLMGNMPYSDAKTKLKLLNANITSLVAKSIKGTPSDSDIERQVLPFHINATDRDSQINEKLLGVQRFIELNREESPLLRDNGISLPTRLKRPSETAAPKGYNK